MEVQYECTLEEKTRVQAILDYWEKQPQEEYKMEFFDEEEKIAFNHLVNCVQDRKQFDFQWSTTPDQEGIMIQNQLELVTQLFSHYQDKINSMMVARPSKTWRTFQSRCIVMM